MDKVRPILLTGENQSGSMSPFQPFVAKIGIAVLQRLKLVPGIFLSQNASAEGEVDEKNFLGCIAEPGVEMGAESGDFAHLVRLLLVLPSPFRRYQNGRQEACSMLPRQESHHPLDKVRFGLMVAIGGEDPKETLEVIAQQMSTVQNELAEIPKRALELGPDFEASAGDKLRRLLAVFQRYSTWLDRTRTALTGGDTASMMELHEESQDLLPTITEALDAYNRAFANFGPFQSAVTNSLRRVAEGIEAGRVVPATWSQYAEFYQSELKSKLESLMQLDLPGRTPLLEGYAEALKLVSQMAAEPPAAADSVNKALDLLDASLAPAEILESVLAESQKEKAAKIPATAALLHVVKNARELLGEELVLAVLDDYNETVEGYLETFERAVARPTHSDLIREEIPRTLDTIDSHFMLIEELNDALEAGETTLEELLQKIQQSADRLVESREVYEVAALHHSYKACPSCSRSNPPENLSCEACGELLPRVDRTARTPSSTFSLMSGPISEETQQAEMTENVARLFQACDDVHDKKIGREQFKEELKRAADSLADFVEEYENQVNLALDESLFSPEEWQSWKSHHLPHLEDLAISYHSGIEDLRSGLVSMEAYLKEPERDHLVEGVRLYWQGIQAIHRGKLAIQTHAKLLDDLFKESQS